MADSGVARASLHDRARATMASPGSDVSDDAPDAAPTRYSKPPARLGDLHYMRPAVWTRLRATRSGRNLRATCPSGIEDPYPCVRLLSDDAVSIPLDVVRR